VKWFIFYQYFKKPVMDAGSVEVGDTGLILDITVLGYL
jgi:hypothetical protein